MLSGASLRLQASQPFASSSSPASPNPAIHNKPVTSAAHMSAGESPLRAANVAQASCPQQPDVVSSKQVEARAATRQQNPNAVSAEEAALLESVAQSQQWRVSLPATCCLFGNQIQGVLEMHPVRTALALHCAHLKVQHPLAAAHPCHSRSRSAHQAVLKIAWQCPPSAICIELRRPCAASAEALRSSQNAPVRTDGC